MTNTMFIFMSIHCQGNEKKSIWSLESTGKTCFSHSSRYKSKKIKNEWLPERSTVDQNGCRHHRSDPHNPVHSLTLVSQVSYTSTHTSKVTAIIIMATAGGQAKAQALNAKLEAAARAELDDIDRKHMRKLARNSYQCVVKCYDKAGSTGAPEMLEQCAQNCQMPHQQANQYMQSVSSI